MNDLFSVKDKVVLITGGSGGIGSALVDGFTKAGARVGTFDKRRPFQANYDRIRYWCPCYLDHPDSVMDAFIKFTSIFDGCSPDILINCAGITCPIDNMDYPETAWDRTIKVNLDAVFRMCKLVGFRMIEKKIKGSIINITSINAAVAMPNNPAYAAAKAGVRQLTKSLALDWGKYNIRVNNIGPGYTKTSMNQKSLDDPEKYKLRADSTMLGRWAEPEEYVGPAIFLASDASSYVTGTDLWVDGGWLSKGILK